MFGVGDGYSIGDGWPADRSSAVRCVSRRGRRSGGAASFAGGPETNALDEEFTRLARD